MRSFSPRYADAPPPPPPAPPPPEPPPLRLSPVSAPTRDELLEKRGVAPRPGLTARTLPEHEQRLAERAQVERELAEGTARLARTGEGRVAGPARKELKRQVAKLKARLAHLSAPEA